MLPNPLDDIARRLVNYEKRISHLERLEEGGGWALIEEIELLVDGPSIDFTNIPDHYRHLHIKFMVRGARPADTVDEVNMRLNGDVGNNYTTLVGQFWHNTQWTTAEFLAQTAFTSFYTMTAANAPANSPTTGYMIFPYYKNTTFLKQALTWSTFRETAVTGDFYYRWATGEWFSTAAINRIQWYSRNANNFLAGSIASLYGIK